MKLGVENNFVATCFNYLLKQTGLIAKILLLLQHMTHATTIAGRCVIVAEPNHAISPQLSLLQNNTHAFGFSTKILIRMIIWKYHVLDLSIKNGITHFGLFSSRVNIHCSCIQSISSKSTMGRGVVKCKDCNGSWVHSFKNRDCLFHNL